MQCDLSSIRSFEDEAREASTKTSFQLVVSVSAATFRECVYQLRTPILRHIMRDASGNRVFPLANHVGIGVRSMALTPTAAADLFMDRLDFVLDYTGLLSSNQ